MTEPLPELLDVKALRIELGVSRAAAEAIMRRLPTVQFEGLRKTYVRRSAVAAYLEARTFEKTEVPASRDHARMGENVMPRQRENAPGPTPKG